MILTEIQNFLTQIMLSIDWDIVFFVGVGFEILLALFFIVKSHYSYEMRMVRKLAKINAWLSRNQYVDSNNLLAFNELMKNTPKQLRHYWHQYMLYRENDPSYYMSTYNCIEKPLKTSSFAANIKNFSGISFAFAFFMLVFGIAALGGDSFQFTSFAKALITPLMIIVLNTIFVMILRARENMNLATLYQYFHYFNRFLDKAVSTMPEYVDFEVLFTRQEIRKGIPVLNEYLEKRARQEQEELEKARMFAVEHEQYNFNDAGIDGALVMDRAMKETETYLNVRQRLLSEIEQYEGEIDSLKRNYENTQKEYQKKLQASKENVDRLRKQQEESTNRIETNYIKKQQSDEIKKQEQLEKDHDTATIRFNQEMETLTEEISTRRKDLSERKQYVEDAMRSEYQTFSSKMYKSVAAVVEERVNEEKQTLVDIKDEIVNQLEEANFVITEKEREITELRALIKKNKIDSSSVDGFYSEKLEAESKKVRRGKRGQVGSKNTIINSETHENTESGKTFENDDIDENSQHAYFAKQENIDSTSNKTENLNINTLENQTEKTSQGNHATQTTKDENIIAVNQNDMFGRENNLQNIDALETEAKKVVSENKPIDDQVTMQLEQSNQLAQLKDSAQKQPNMMGNVQTFEDYEKSLNDQKNTKQNYAVLQEPDEKNNLQTEELAQETSNFKSAAQVAAETEKPKNEESARASGKLNGDADSEDTDGNVQKPFEIIYDENGCYYDETGNYIYPTGAYYDPEGRYHDEFGGWFEADGETYHPADENSENEESDSAEQKPFEIIYDENGCYYDEAGNYIYPNGAYYDPEGRYHDEFGGWFEPDGETYHAAEEAKTKVEYNNFSDKTKAALAENFGIKEDPRDEEKRRARERKEQEKLAREAAKKARKEDKIAEKLAKLEAKNKEKENIQSVKNFETDAHNNNVKANLVQPDFSQQLQTDYTLQHENLLPLNDEQLAITENFEAEENVSQTEHAQQEPALLEADLYGTEREANKKTDENENAQNESSENFENQLDDNNLNLDRYSFDFGDLEAKPKTQKDSFILDDYENLPENKRSYVNADKNENLVRENTNFDEDKTSANAHNLNKFQPENFNNLDNWHAGAGSKDVVEAEDEVNKSSVYSENFKTTQDDKQNLEKSTEPAKKRGRPRKVESSPNLNTEALEVLKKVGRPKKMQSNTAQAEVKKQKVGRPRKVLTAEEKAKTSEPKKAVGRPRKVDVAKNNSNPNQAKKPAQPKAVGRPKKLLDENLEAKHKISNVQNIINAKPKKAGRPKKLEIVSKNALPTVTKKEKSVGRPRKKQSLENLNLLDYPAVKKSVGRPKKASTSQSQTAKALTGGENNAPIKRGRGRPKKADVDEIQRLNQEIENENKLLKQRQKELKSQLDETLSILQDELE